MTAIAGTVQAFYYNNLYPSTVFAVGNSVELMSAPIVGGLGTLFGPLLGAFALTTLGETMTSLTAGLHLDGIKQWCYGAVLLLIVALQPGGIWPWLARRLRLGGEERAPMSERAASRSGGRQQALPRPPGGG